MRLLLVNPNTTAAMTEEMAVAARSVASPDVEIEPVTARRGVASIDGYHDELLGAAAVAEAIEEHDGDFDGAIVACFGDPGLYAARELTRASVVGIAEASFLLASTLGERFSILTTLERGVPPLADVVRLYGFEPRCASIRATGLTVLEADAEPERAADALEQVGQTAIREDHADVICLGCGGMVGLRERLEERLGVPVIEGVPAAVGVVQALIRAGLRTSKARGFKQPEPNAYTA